MFHSRKAEKINALVCNLSLCYSQLSRNQTACTAISLLLKSHCTIITLLWLEGSKIALAAKVKGDRKKVSLAADGIILALQDNIVGIVTWKAWCVGKVEATPSLHLTSFVVALHATKAHSGSYSGHCPWDQSCLEASAVIAGSRKLLSHTSKTQHRAVAVGCSCPSVA